MDVTESLAVEPPERAAQSLHMLADHVIREVAIGPRGLRSRQIRSGTLSTIATGMQ